jgi:hypothetical protein
MRDVCHCTAPIAALNISTFAKVGGSATSRQSLGVAASRVGFSRRIMKGRITRRHAVDVNAGTPTHGYAETREAATAAFAKELAAGIIRSARPTVLLANS